MRQWSVHCVTLPSRERFQMKYLNMWLSLACNFFKNALSADRCTQLVMPSLKAIRYSWLPLGKNRRIWKSRKFLTYNFEHASHHCASSAGDVSSCLRPSPPPPFRMFDRCVGQMVDRLIGDLVQRGPKLGPSRNQHGSKLDQVCNTFGPSWVPKIAKLLLSWRHF